MTKTQMMLVGFGVLGTAMVAASFLLIRTMPVGECVNEEVERLPAQGGSLEAVLFERRCGGDEGPVSAHISIVEGGAPLPNAYGNALSIRDSGARDVITARWRENNVLAVSVPSGLRPQLAASPPFAAAIDLDTDE